MKGSNGVKYLISPDVQWFLGTSLLIRCHNLIYPLAIFFFQSTKVKHSLTVILLIKCCWLKYAKKIYNHEHFYLSDIYLFIYRTCLYHFQVPHLKVGTNRKYFYIPGVKILNILFPSKMATPVKTRSNTNTCIFLQSNKRLWSLLLSELSLQTVT